MREIKFRAWLKKQKLMRYNVSIHAGQIFTGHCWIPFDNNVELMQYVGLKDKNGVKIFEGDIVRCDDEICTIVWDEPYVLYAVSSKENGNDSLGDFEPKDLEVIGNIYENKELLGWI